MKYVVNTSLLPNKKILQDVTLEDDAGLRETIIRQIFDTLEFQAKSALIELGWTPPKEAS